MLAIMTGGASLQVEVRDNEVWLVRNGEPRQLTHDGKSKLQALLSPSHNRIAYYEQCPQSERCIPSIVILDLEGRRTKSFHPNHQADNEETACSSILSIAWSSESTITAECHINPSLSEYVETEISSGAVTRDLFGYGFAPSPDGKRVAHAGWIPHFSPPFAKSNYLQIDNTTIYPLPSGEKPTVRKTTEGAPDVVRTQDSTYYGIHEFESDFAWSPDSQRIALIDCVYDWRATNQESTHGVELNRRCAMPIVSLNGRLKLFSLNATESRDVTGARLLWKSPRQISVTGPGFSKTIDLP